MLKDKVIKTEGGTTETNPFKFIKECAEYFVEELSQVINDQIKFAES